MSINKQAIEKFDSSETLSVNSIFYTIQGEGPFAGFPSVFVRLAGCNLRCPMCDTEYTSREEMTVKSVVEKIKSLSGSNKKLVVITGGEPYRQSATLWLLYALIEQRYQVQVETNGLFYTASYTHSQKFSSFLTNVISPKTPKIHTGWTDVKDVYFKYVINHKFVDPENGLPTKALNNGNGKHKLFIPTDFPKERIFINPEDSYDEETNKLNRLAALSSCLKFGYRLGVQMHKIYGVA